MPRGPNKEYRLAQPLRCFCLPGTGTCQSAGFQLNSLNPKLMPSSILLILMAFIPQRLMLVISYPFVSHLDSVNVKVESNPVDR